MIRARFGISKLSVDSSIVFTNCNLLLQLPGVTSNMINLLLSCLWMPVPFTDKLLALVCIWKLLLLFPFLLLLPKTAGSRSSLNWLLGGNNPIRCTNRYIFSFKKKRSCIHHCGRGTRIGWKFGPNQFLSCAVPGQCTASRQPKPPKKRKRGCTLSLITLCFLPVIVNFAHGAPTAAHTKSPISSRQSFIPRTPQTAAERNAKTKPQLLKTIVAGESNVETGQTSKKKLKTLVGARIRRMNKRKPTLLTNGRIEKQTEMTLTVAGNNSAGIELMNRKKLTMLSAMLVTGTTKSKSAIKSLSKLKH